MKKYASLIVLIIMSVFIISNCNTAKKSTATVAPPVPVALSYAANIKSVVAATCAPCHIPAEGGNKKALDTYDALKANIDDVVRRIELQPTDRGFMPMKHPRLGIDTIEVFKQWRDAGMAE